MSDLILEQYGIPDLFFFRGHQLALTFQAGCHTQVFIKGI